MRKNVVAMVKLGVLALGVVAALAYSTPALARRPGGGGGLGGCPRDIQCPDVYDPVTCSNGVEYPNACYAYRDCATGCGSSGGT